MKVSVQSGLTYWGMSKERSHFYSLSISETARGLQTPLHRYATWFSRSYRSTVFGSEAAVTKRNGRSWDVYLVRLSPVRIRQPQHGEKKKG